MKLIAYSFFKIQKNSSNFLKIHLRKKYYFECIKYRYENSLYKTYLKLLEKEGKDS